MFAAGTAAAIIRTPGLIMPVKPLEIPCDFDTANLRVTASVRWNDIYISDEWLSRFAYKYVEIGYDITRAALVT